jgi:hypothetical protein
MDYAVQRRVIAVFGLLAHGVNAPLGARLVKSRLDVLGVPPARFDGMNRDGTSDEGVLTRILGKIRCVGVTGREHVPDGSMELWDKTCEAHTFNVILSLLVPFVKALTQPLVLLEQHLEHNGMFLRFALRERVIHGLGRVEYLAQQLIAANPNLSHAEATQRGAIDFSEQVARYEQEQQDLRKTWADNPSAAAEPAVTNLEVGQSSWMPALCDALAYLEFRRISSPTAPLKITTEVGTRQSSVFGLSQGPDDVALRGDVSGALGEDEEQRPQAVPGPGPVRALRGDDDGDRRC